MRAEMGSADGERERRHWCGGGGGWSSGGEKMSSNDGGTMPGPSYRRHKSTMTFVCNPSDQEETSERKNKT